jgi:hypothetical protein
MEVGRGNAECGLRPLRAVGSLYEPEAIGAYTYAPVGSRKNQLPKGRRSESKRQMTNFKKPEFKIILLAAAPLEKLRDASTSRSHNL